MNNSNLENVEKSVPEHKVHKFHTLDALRGVAALVVVMFHRHSFFCTYTFPHGYLAVDFFFMLSGFVVTYAYQEKIDAGWSTWAFMKTRFARLYPLYFMGLLIGMLVLLSERHFLNHYVSRASFVVSSVLGTVLMPTPVRMKGLKNNLFPLNLAAWSLFFEMSANFLHALFLRRVRRSVPAKALLLIVVSGAIFVVVSIHLGTTDFGFEPGQILEGFTRVLFSYFFGFLLHQLWKSTTFRFKIPPVFSAISLVILLASPKSMHGEIAYELVTIVFLFPLLLFTSASSEPSPRLRPLATILGLTSYAVYILHEPLGDALGLVWNLSFGRDMRMDRPVSGVVYVLLLLASVVAADRYYDRPMRSALRTWLFREKPRIGLNT